MKSYYGTKFIVAIIITAILVTLAFCSCSSSKGCYINVHSNERIKMQRKYVIPKSTTRILYGQYKN